MQNSRPLPRALAILATEKNRAADAALFEALPHVAPEMQAAVIDALFRRDHTATLLHVVRSAAALGPHVRGLLASRMRNLHGALRAAVASAALENRTAAIELITASADASSAEILSDALRSRCNRTREFAAAALQEITRRVIEDPPSSERPGARAARLDCVAAALREAVLRWEAHFQPKALEAALWLFDRVEPVITQKLREPQTKIGHMLGEIIAGATDPKLAGAVLRALSLPELRNSAASAVTRAKNPLFIRAILSEAWILADREVEHGLRWVAEGRWLDDWAAVLPRAPDLEAARMVHVLSALGGSPERRMERFRGVLGWPRPAARRAALWQLVGDRSDQATEALQLLASRTGDELSAVAARECRRRRPGAPKGAYAASRPSDWFAGFLADFDRLMPALRREHITRAKAELPRVREVLRDKLRAADATDRARALQVSREMGLVPDFEEEVYRLACDPDRVVRAAAVATLMVLPTPTTTRILRAALHDPDERVQANAIEVMDRLAIEGRAESIRPKLESASGRVRANAVRALLRLEVREAGDALLDMLENSTEAQRVSALWVIERMRLHSIVHRVLEMSRSDPDERVRRRAQRVLAELRAPEPGKTAGPRGTGPLGHASSPTGRA